MNPQPTDGYSITLRLALANKPGVLGLLTSTIGAIGGSIGAIDIVEAGFDQVIRDVTVATGNDRHAQEIVDAVKVLPGVTFIQMSDRVFLLHIGGKIEVKSKIAIQTRADLSRAYTPGVARVCLAIHEDPSKVFNLTIKRNCHRWHRRAGPRRHRPRRGHAGDGGQGDALQGIR